MVNFFGDKLSESSAWQIYSETACSDSYVPETFIPADGFRRFTHIEQRAFCADVENCAWCYQPFSPNERRPHTCKYCGGPK